MTQLRRSALILLHILLLTLPALATAAAPAHAAPAKSCRPDQLKSATVKAGAEFKHRGTDNSMLRSTMDITVPAGWEHASDLLLDAHSPDHRYALRCLVGKDPTKENKVDNDYEWRLKPLVVKAYDKHVAVHYEAVTWIKSVNPYNTGPWVLFPEDDEWLIRLRASPNIAGARWEEVYLRLGGPGALSASPPPEFGEGGAVLTWRGEQPAPAVRVSFHQPTAQYWNAVAESEHLAWAVWGRKGASGAFSYVATAVLLLVVGKRLGGGLKRKPMPQDAYALRVLRVWAFLMIVFGLLVHLGDDANRSMRRLLGLAGDHGEAVGLFTLAALGLVLCVFGGLKKQALAAAGAFFGLLVALYVTSQYFEIPILPTVEVATPLKSHWMVSVFYTAAIAVCCLGMIASAERVLLMGEKRLPAWVMVASATATALLMTLWAYIAIHRSWERVSWLLEPDSPEQEQAWKWWLSFGWVRLPGDALYSLLSLSAVLAPLALIGVLRVCRREKFEPESFTPTQSESFLLISLFGIVAAGEVWYFGYSGYLLGLLLVLVAAWGVVALGSRLSVLGKLSVGDAPLGSVISRTDRSDVLRLARHFRELQSRLHRLSASTPSERSAAQEAIEAEIDRLDHALPEGVRPADLPFACGPMDTWWGNACRGAMIACFVGLPATGLMYWKETVSGEFWVFVTEEPAGFLTILANIVSWQVTWVMGGFVLGALWRSLPGRRGPTKACWVAAVFAVPVLTSHLIVRAVGQDEGGVVAIIATFASVMTFTGFAMDVQTFRGERRYWSTNASLVAYVYQMRIASVAFFLAQLVALATIWKTFQDGGPSGPSGGP
ncbi:hypothetical protein SUDANB120_01150 [Streptomyces sp. enrichment culture]|uniref:DUF6185 family protein n=1 Tax=Streptomyces TaxID=1883 RepID=UPI001679B9B4|nr:MULTISPECIES: DUF6185 family protein [Streptomyces]MBD3579964.1 hypothetical protein [Streptomyces sp. KD18]GGT27872.1 hypothetical protein GCM10010286_61550 [Streptomyces toxytricini]